MLQPKYTKQFKKDLKIQKKRGKYINKIKLVIEKLVAEETLPPEYQDRLFSPYSLQTKYPKKSTETPLFCIFSLKTYKTIKCSRKKRPMG